jgi:hypothetical protein
LRSALPGAKHGLWQPPRNSCNDQNLRGDYRKVVFSLRQSGTPDSRRFRILAFATPKHEIASDDRFHAAAGGSGEIAGHRVTRVVIKIIGHVRYTAYDYRSHCYPLSSRNADATMAVMYRAHRWPNRVLGTVGSGRCLCSISPRRWGRRSNGGATLYFSHPSNNSKGKTHGETG